MPKLKDLQGEHILAAHLPGQATAGTEDDWVAFVAPFDLTVTRARWIPNAAITANGTNFFVLEVFNGATRIASRSYAATNSVALTSEDMTLDAAANLDVAEGAVIFAHKETSGGGTGLAMPDGTLQLHVKRR